MICLNCGKQTQLYIAKVKSGYLCWNCQKPMDILLICDPEQVDFDMFSLFAYEKPDNIIDIAKEHGVKIEKRYVKLTREKYIAHTCPHCDVVQGDHYIVCDNHQWSFLSTKETFEIYYCSDCNRFYVA